MELNGLGGIFDKGLSGASGDIGSEEITIDLTEAAPEASNVDEKKDLGEVFIKAEGGSANESDSKAAWTDKVGAVELESKGAGPNAGRDRVNKALSELEGYLERGGVILEGRTNIIETEAGVNVIGTDDPDVVMLTDHETGDILVRSQNIKHLYPEL